MFNSKKIVIPSPAEALPGRDHAMPIYNEHFVLGHPIAPPMPQGIEQAMFGMGCFWGVERKFWQCAGVYSTAVGYTGGITPNTTYDELCTGLTGHNEVVKVFFNADDIAYDALLQLFWESHNPTQGMQQGNDIGTQYRSGIYTFNDEQYALAMTSKAHYQAQLSRAGYGEITTEILPASTFYYAERYHQQYLAKEPMGYCGVGGLGVPFKA
ncbi:MAG: peptide-methionine (S)-S-oxide reductase MsrA [Methylococcaceae bacterium]|nr:MAG: peptide-methionine (S)-S-oxide reductase MsrA [Methylococcaceae bacterium]